MEYTHSYECKICKKTYASEKRLKNHMADFTCRICKKHFFLKRDLKIHIETHADERSFKCDKCMESFDSHLNFIQHSVLCNTETSCVTFKCDLCLNVYKTEGAKKQHMRNLTCNFCKEHFRNTISYEVHMARHAGEKIFKCNKCLKCFPIEVYLKQHAECHRTVNYQCGVCGAAYRRIQYWKRHMKIHSVKKTEQPFKCHICFESFTEIYSVTNHMTMHPDKNIMECVPCQNISENKEALALHITRCHEKSQFTSFHEEHEKKNIDDELFGCELCHKKFKHNKTLKNHMLKVHMDEKPFKCPECPKSFVLDTFLLAHMQCHLNEKSFKCNVCKKCYKYKSAMNKHITVHLKENQSNPTSSLNDSLGKKG